MNYVNLVIDNKLLKNKSISKNSKVFLNFL